MKKMLMNHETTIKTFSFATPTTTKKNDEKKKIEEGKSIKKQKKNKQSQGSKKAKRGEDIRVVHFQLQASMFVKLEKFIGDGNSQVHNYLLIVKLQQPKPLHLKHL